MALFIQSLQLLLITCIGLWCARLYTLSKRESAVIEDKSTIYESESIEAAPAVIETEAEIETDTAASTLSNPLAHDIDYEPITVDTIEVERKPYEIKLSSLKEAQIFAGMEMLPVKREFPNLQSEQLGWLREAIALYLIGSSELISKKADCDIRTRNKLTKLVLSSNLKMNEVESEHMLQTARNRSLSSDNDLMVRAGAKAATQWLTTKQVEQPLTLREMMNHWGVFA